jgi:hypothetical protein
MVSGATLDPHPHNFPSLVLPFGVNLLPRVQRGILGISQNSRSMIGIPSFVTRSNETLPIYGFHQHLYVPLCLFIPPPLATTIEVRISLVIAMSSHP